MPEPPWPSRCRQGLSARKCTLISYARKPMAMHTTHASCQANFPVLHYILDLKHNVCHWQIHNLIVDSTLNPSLKLNLRNRLRPGFLLKHPRTQVTTSSINTFKFKRVLRISNESAILLALLNPTPGNTLHPCKYQNGCDPSRSRIHLPNHSRKSGDSSPLVFTPSLRLFLSCW